MAGGTFKMSQPKVRPGTYVNVKNGRQATAPSSTRGVGVIPLIGNDWGPRGQWIVVSSDSPDGHLSEFGRSIYDDSNSAMIMLQLMLLGATTVYVYIPDGGKAASGKTTLDASKEMTITAKYKGSLGNKIKIVSVENPAGGFDVSVILDGSEVELFEGVKTAYCPGFHKLLGIAASGSIGAIRNIEACFTKLEKPVTRELTDAVYGGSCTELGSYIMLPVLNLLGDAYTNYRFESLRGENGLDVFTKLSFTYPHALATHTCGLGVKSEGRLLISGTKGYIVAEAPWWKTTYFEIHYEDASHVQKYSDTYLGDGLRYEISDFLTKLRGNESSNFKLTAEESIFMADMMEKRREKYEAAADVVIQTDNKSILEISEELISKLTELDEENV